MSYHAVYYADGTGEYRLPEPLQSSLEFAIVDETPGGATISSGYGTATMTFERLTVAQYDAIRTRRSALGAIRFRLQNGSDQWVICEGRVDPNPAPRVKYRGEIARPVFTFRRVTVVG